MLVMSQRQHQSRLSGNYSAGLVRSQICGLPGECRQLPDKPTRLSILSRASSCGDSWLVRHESKFGHQQGELADQQADTVKMFAS